MKRLNVELSDDLYEKLQCIQKELGKSSLADVIRTGIAVLDTASEGRKAGKSLGIIAEDNGNYKVDSKLVI